MENGFKKFAKGMVAIFTIKLLLVGTIFVIQSCQTDNEIFENPEQQIALNKFESLAKKTTIRLESVAIKQNSLLIAKSANFEEIQNQTEQEAKDVLKPLIEGTKELFSSYGVEESDFLEELDSEDPRIAILGLALLSAKNNDNEVAVNLSGLFVSDMYAQDAYDCALRAVGIDAIIELFKGKVTRKIAKKALRKIASRALGWVGAAWAAYEFGDCMGWY